jgi:hypothetical protein
MPFSAVPHYLCVFRAAEDVTDDVVDTGQDPDFRPPVATWGICRPNIRRSVRAGSHVVFVGYFPAARRYLVKGWLRVADSIGYLQALERFPDRPNVIIRDADTVAGLPAVARNWKRADLRDEAFQRTGTLAPSFLTTIDVDGRRLVQLPCDDHEIDNWKCQRMYRCRRAQLSACIAAEACLWEQQFASLRGYIVADTHRDIGKELLEWQVVAPPDLAERPVRTPYGQHNPIRLSDADLAAILAIMR